MLAVGNLGIGLSSWPLYAPDMYTGIVLITALAITASGRRRRSLGRLAFWRTGKAGAPAPSARPPEAS
jgi:hypothetical protein